MANRTGAGLVFLTGFMGAGKTTVGSALAAVLGWNFIDLDDFIEARAGKKIAEIFAGEGSALGGEEHFRRLESRALGRVIGDATSRPIAAAGTVVALGGGTLQQAQNRVMIDQAAGTVVFLESTAEALFERCQAAPGTRPLHSGLDTFAATYRQRLPVYRESALSVTTDGKSPQQIAAELAALLKATNEISRREAQ